jgi:PAS domain S-box-containing protein
MKIKNILILIFVFFLYFITGKIGLYFATVHPSATAIWAPTGIAIGSLLVFGRKALPAIFLGAFLTNFTTSGTALSSIGIALGNTFEGFIAAHLIEMFADGRRALNTPRGILKFIIIILFSCMISATWGVSTLLLSGLADGDKTASIWFTWWLGDISGGIIVAPFFLFWTKKYLYHWNNDRRLEGVTLLLAIVIVSGAIFNGIFLKLPLFLSLEFLIIPLLVWASLRFDRREVITAIVIVAAVSTWGTVRGYGPFSRYKMEESLILLQTFFDVVTIMILALSAVVAERKRVQRLFRSTLDNMREGFQIIGFDYKYIYVNNAVAVQGKKKQEDLLGKSMMEMYPGIENTPMFTYLRKCMLERIPHEMDNKFQYPDGSQRWFRLKIEPIAEGALILSIDITREKEIDDMKTEFISMASHELRTPLSAIKGFISMLIEGDYGKVDKKFARPLALVSESTNRLIKIVNEMLDVSRIEAERVMVHVDTYQLDPLISEVVSNLKPLVDEKNLKLSVEKDSSLQISADKEKVIQILTNLIGNAIKFTEKGSIGINAKLIKNMVVVYVSDTGRGIAQSDKEKLFNKFEQLKSKKEGKVAGTGLGLYISREFARKMKGDLWIEKSTGGKGSTFALSLPAVLSKNKLL